MQSFSALLDTLNQASPERQPAIEQLILDTFQRRKAVLALDMSGFTLTVRRDGILAYLRQIRRMQQITTPLVLAYQGAVVKNEADNLLAVFDDAQQAVRAALAMLASAAMTATATAVAAGSDSGAPAIAFSIGIDYGDVLLIDHVDCFGDAVNLAYKLGEDIARAGELLVTQAIRDQLGAGAGMAGLQLQDMTVSVSGLAVVAYAVTPTPQ